MARQSERWAAVGAEIRAARTDHGYTGKDIERLTDGVVTQNRLSKIEVASREFVPVEELEALAKVLDLDLDVLALMAYGATRPPAGSALKARRGA